MSYPPRHLRQLLAPIDRHHEQRLAGLAPDQILSLIADVRGLHARIGRLEAALHIAPEPRPWWRRLLGWR